MNNLRFLFKLTPEQPALTPVAAESCKMTLGMFLADQKAVE